MTLKVTFELSNKDLRHFRAIMREARQAAKQTPDEEIISAAQGLLDEVAEVSVPDFVAQRLARLQRLIDMLHDEEWQIPARERTRVLNALAYFTEPDDLIPDHIPGLGFLDDAIMVELVARELRHEIEAYEDFCAFRDDLKKKRSAEATASATLSREERLAKRRKALHERMRRRSTRRRRKGRGSSGPRVTLF
ncbi:MAG: DUF1232 domain-containing protein [Gammaproteobacteria bacterium]|nr:DUF1232 domain-containing protein [Gammaproteobacteria bacterium]